MKTMKGTGRKRCRKGKSCGETCIYRGLVCRVDLGQVMSASLASASGSVSGAPLPAPKLSEVERLTLEIRRKYLRKEDYSGEVQRLSVLINSLEGDKKREATIKFNIAIGKRLKININHRSESIGSAQRAGRSFLEEFRSLKRVSDLVNRYESLFNQVGSRVSAGMTKEQKDEVRSRLLTIIENKYRAEKRLVALMTSIRERMMETTLSEAQVKDLASRVWSVNASEATRNNMVEFIRMFNGRGFTDTGGSAKGAPVRTIYDASDRAHAKVIKGIVKTHADDKPTTFHEIAHIIEGQRPWMSEFAVRWRDSRAFDNISEIRRDLSNNSIIAQSFYPTGPGTSAPLVKMRDLHPGSGYDEREVGLVDKYAHRYMGKVYRNTGRPDAPQIVTEVWSMAIEQFAYPETMATFYRKHPELFEIVAGLAVSP